MSETDSVTPPERARLRLLAQVATPGRWRSHPTHWLRNGPAVTTARGEFVAACAVDAACQGISDAEFIAAASPAVVLALLAELERAEAIVLVMGLGWSYEDEHGAWYEDGALRCLDEDLVACVAEMTFRAPAQPIAPEPA